jgi:hypothetical protein
MATMRTVLSICGVIALSVLPAHGGEPLKLTVTPFQSFAPATVRVRARIEPNAENRILTIVADGQAFYRSSDIPLEGELAPKTVELNFSNLPGGEYEVYAVLRDSVGRQRAFLRQRTRVISMMDN